MRAFEYLYLYFQAAASVPEGSSEGCKYNFLVFVANGKAPMRTCELGSVAGDFGMDGVLRV